MGPGHFAVGLVIKPAAPKIPRWGSGPGLIASIILELALTGAGLAFYLSTRKRKTLQEQK